MARENYFPRPVPQTKDFASLSQFLEEELSRLAGALQSTEFLWLDETNVAPTRPRAGEIRFADGTNWNPGSGKGIYAYYASAWHLLG